MSIAQYERFVEKQYERLKGKDAFIPWTSYEFLIKGNFNGKRLRLSQE
jgi:hypothetical protein